jgi:hypothetical protein
MLAVLSAPEHPFTLCTDLIFSRTVTRKQNHQSLAAWRRVAAAGMLCLWALSIGPSAHARGGALYTAAKISVDVTAKDAVAAKNEALRQAKQRALRTVFKRLAPYSAFERLPEVKTAAIEDMLTNFSVRREANSQTRYLATLDFQFNANAVHRLLDEANIPYADVQAAVVLLLPIYIRDGKVDTTGRDPWRQAWLALDFEHSVAPARLARHGPDLDAEAVKAILSGEGDGFDALMEKHKTDTLVLAVAETATGTNELTVRLYGIDAAGPFALARSAKVHDDHLAAAAQRSAKLALGVLEGRWKLTQSIPESGAGDSARHSVTLTVEFSSLRQWQQIRSRLAKVPGVQAMEVASLSARSADVTFRFPGGAQSLSAKLAAHNMALSNVGGAWVLRSSEQ